MTLSFHIGNPHGRGAPYRHRRFNVGPPHRSCRYPHGDPGEPGFHFCGKPVKEGSSYCSKHHAITHLPATAPRWGWRRL